MRPTRNAKSEGSRRNPKSEIRNTKEIRNAKSEIRRPRSQSVWVLALHSILRPQALACHAATLPDKGPDVDFRFRISDFGFPSDFGLRGFGFPSPLP